MPSRKQWASSTKERRVQRADIIEESSGGGVGLSEKTNMLQSDKLSFKKSENVIYAVLDPCEADNTSAQVEFIL